MPKKALASLNVVINAVTSPLFRGLNKASKRLTVFGAKMKAIGRSISMSFSLPFAAIGVAGAKMAIDFQKNMTKINTLVGISAKEVNEFSKDVMKLSGETAQAPAELAEGLFFLTSAGLRGANAMETLEAVSKATAIGLGEQADLAKVAAAAQNAYGKENLSASKALDIFGGAVREGMFEASELAEVLGTQLGLSSSLGISFEETSAFIATYTKVTGDAKSASTSFGGVMMALAKTTPKMEKALNQIGMSGDSVRTMLGDQGLKATLEHLKTSFEENNIPLTEFFSKSQALKGVLGVLGNQTETYGQVLEGMGSSVGMVEDGFDTFSETAGFKMEKAFTNLKNAASELGAIMLPVFTAIVNGAVKLGKAFTELDSGTKKIIVATATLVAFSGPLMTLAGGLVSALGMILSPIGLVVVALGALFSVIYNNWGATKSIFVNFINYFINLYNESTIFRGAVELIIASFKNLWTQIKFTFESAQAVISGFITMFVGQFKGLATIIEGALTLDWDKVKEGGKQYGKAIEDGVGEAWDGIVDAGEKAAEEMANTMADAFDNTMSQEKIEFVSEDDIQAGVDNVGKWLEEKLGKVRDKMKGFMGSSILATPDSGGGDSGGGESSMSGGIGNIDTSGQESALQSFWGFTKEGYEEMANKVSQSWGKISEVAGAALNGIGNLFAAQHEAQMTILDNEQTKAEETYNADYEREKAAIERSVALGANKDAQLAKLDKKFGDKKAAMDEKFDAKRKALQAKQARRDKAMKIASAIMSTANAVVNALAQGGPYAGPILAVMMGALGAAQVAAIAATPIPLAKGGLAFGPTNAIVGDNPGAANDPEVIAPLSKLKGMMGNTAGNVELKVGGIVKGQDIWLSNDETTEQRPRYI